MKAQPQIVRVSGSEVLVQIQVSPRAARSRLVGAHGGRLKVQVAAPPVDGKANQELSRFVAETLGVHRSAVRVVRGETSRQKTLAIQGVRRSEVCLRLGVEG